MIKCDEFSHVLLDLDSIATFKNIVVLKGTIDSIDRETGLVNLTYETMCAGVDVPSTDVPVMYHCQYADGSSDDVENFGHLAFSNGDSVYVHHIRGSDDIPSQTYVIGHQGTPNVVPCKTEWLVVRLVQSASYTSNHGTAFVTIIDPATGDVYDGWSSVPVEDQTIMGSGVTFPVSTDDPDFIKKALLLEPVAKYAFRYYSSDDYYAYFPTLTKGADGWYFNSTLLTQALDYVGQEWVVNGVTDGGGSWFDFHFNQFATNPFRHTGLFENSPTSSNTLTSGSEGGGTISYEVLCDTLSDPLEESLCYHGTSPDAWSWGRDIEESSTVGADVWVQIGTSTSITDTGSSFDYLQEFDSNDYNRFLQNNEWVTHGGTSYRLHPLSVVDGSSLDVSYSYDYADVCTAVGYISPGWGNWVAYSFTDNTLAGIMQVDVYTNKQVSTSGSHLDDYDIVCIPGDPSGTCYGLEGGATTSSDTSVTADFTAIAPWGAQVLSYTLTGSYNYNSTFPRTSDPSATVNDVVSPSISWAIGSGGVSLKPAIATSCVTGGTLGIYGLSVMSVYDDGAYTCSGSYTNSSGSFIDYRDYIDGSIDLSAVVSGVSFVFRPYNAEYDYNTPSTYSFDKFKEMHLAEEVLKSHIAEMLEGLNEIIMQEVIDTYGPITGHQFFDMARGYHLDCFVATIIDTK